MSEGIVVALIGAASVVVAAIINTVGKKKGNKTEESKEKRISVEQNAKGKNISQIGIQVSIGKDEDNHE